MGLFDGARGPAGRRGAAADLARRYGWPVVLVIDCRAMSQTAAAIALGLAPLRSVRPRRRRDPQQCRQRTPPRRAPRRLRRPRPAAARRACHAIRARPLPERHLGLVQAERASPRSKTSSTGSPRRSKAIAIVAALVALAGGRDLSARRDDRAPSPLRARASPSPATPPSPSSTRTSLAGWRAGGAADRILLSTGTTRPPPADCDACFLPGGYPELHAGQTRRSAQFLRRPDAPSPPHGPSTANAAATWCSAETLD